MIKIQIFLLLLAVIASVNAVAPEIDSPPHLRGERSALRALRGKETAPHAAAEGKGKGEGKKEGKMEKDTRGSDVESGKGKGGKGKGGKGKGGKGSSGGNLGGGGNQNQNGSCDRSYFCGNPTPITSINCNDSCDCSSGCCITLGFNNFCVGYDTTAVDANECCIQPTVSGGL